MTEWNPEIYRLFRITASDWVNLTARQAGLLGRIAGYLQWHRHMAGGR